MVWYEQGLKYILMINYTYYTFIRSALQKSIFGLLDLAIMVTFDSAL
jgi:hypothetical protein